MDPKYRCCICGFHVVKATKIICYFEIIKEIIITIIGCIFLQEKLKTRFFYLIVTLVLSAITLAGISNRNHKRLLPNLICEIIAIPLYVIYLLLIISGLIVYHPEYREAIYDSSKSLFTNWLDTNHELTLAINISITIFNLLLLTWTTLILYRCYQYLKYGWKEENDDGDEIKA